MFSVSINQISSKSFLKPIPLVSPLLLHLSFLKYNCDLSAETSLMSRFTCGVYCATNWLKTEVIIIFLSRVIEF